MKKHPLAHWLSVICLPLCMSLISFAQDGAKDAPKAEVGEDLYKKVLGYWVMDFDAAETKAFVAETVKQGAPENVQKEMEASTFEFKPGQMLIHQPGDTIVVNIAVKSQDLEKGVLVADFKDDDNEPTPTTLRINGNLLVLAAKEDGEIGASFGMKRIDEETFKKRVPEPKQEKNEEEVKEPQAALLKEGYPVGAAVPDKPGFVFSPYNNRIVDVREIPSGTLVMDPHYPSEEKKMFWVP